MSWGARVVRWKCSPVCELHAIKVPLPKRHSAPAAMRRTMLLGLLGTAAALHPQLRAAARPRQQRHAPWSVRMDEGRGAKIAKLEATLEELEAAGIDQARRMHAHAHSTRARHAPRALTSRTCAPPGGDRPAARGALAAQARREARRAQAGLTLALTLTLTLTLAPTLTLTLTLALALSPTPKPNLKPKPGKLYELDGLKDGPINLGEISGDWLDTVGDLGEI